MGKRDARHNGDVPGEHRREPAGGSRPDDAKLVAEGSRIGAAIRGPGGYGVEVERVESVDAELGQQIDAVYRGGRGNARQRLGQSRVCFGMVAECLLTRPSLSGGGLPPYCSRRTSSRPAGMATSTPSRC
jgi:hypothetical protein